MVRGFEPEKETSREAATGTVRESICENDAWDAQLPGVEEYRPRGGIANLTLRKPAKPAKNATQTAVMLGRRTGPPR